MMGTLLALFLALSTPCQTEDSSNCTWDAQHRGNDLGHSFVTFGDSTLYFN